MELTSVLDMPNRPEANKVPPGSEAHRQAPEVARSKRPFGCEAYGLLLVLAGYALALALSWRKWPELLVDFGTQLYLPWQISEGSVLYRDVMYLTGGPLSQYYHALLFHLFGPSVLAIVISNILLGLGLLVLLYRCFLASSDVWTATAIGLGVALVLACNTYSNIGNFNFITPYCHEVWHGLVLSAIGIALLAKWVQRSVPGPGHSNARHSKGFRMLPMWGAGICAGLVFMTKPEMFVALMIAFLAALALVGFARGACPASGTATEAVQAQANCSQTWKTAGGAHNCLNERAEPSHVAVPEAGHAPGSRCVCSVKGVGWALAGAALPLIAFLIWFHRTESWHDSFRSVAYAWVPLLGSYVSQQFYYKWCLGLDAPGFHVRMLIAHLLVVIAALAALAFTFRQKLDTPVRRLLAIGLVAVLIGLASAFDWVDCGRLLPVFALALCVMVGSMLLRRADEIGKRPAVYPFIWAVFALALLAKLGFYSRIWHYGFALALPAFAAALFLLVWVLPSTLERFGVNRKWFRAAITVLLAVGCLSLLIQSQHLYATKALPVGGGSDRILTQTESVNPAGAAVRDTLDWLNQNAAPEATLAVLPEGVMINYLSRRVNPTRYLVWNPAEIASFGQEKMTQAFCSHPPDYVILVHRDASEYGADFFGRKKSFGGELLEWVNANYEPVHLIGKEPLRDGRFGVKILKRATSLQAMTR